MEELDKVLNEIMSGSVKIATLKQQYRRLMDPRTPSQLLMKANVGGSEIEAFIETAWLCNKLKQDVECISESVGHLTAKTLSAIELTDDDTDRVVAGFGEIMSEEELPEDLVQDAVRKRKIEKEKEDARADDRESFL